MSKYYINDKDLANFVMPNSRTSSDIPNYYLSFPGESNTEQLIDVPTTPLNPKDNGTSNFCAIPSTGYYTIGNNDDAANKRTAVFSDFKVSGTFNLSPYAPTGTVAIRAICIGGSGGGGGGGY
jgi:hypothetical protein